jgi:hypothetical protein
VHVARYYYKRGAYVAAANRAQQTVSEYQQTPATEEALYLMVLSYDKLDMSDPARRPTACCGKNFPNSRFLRDGLVQARAELVAVLVSGQGTSPVGLVKAPRCPQPANASASAASRVIGGIAERRRAP